MATINLINSDKIVLIDDMNFEFLNKFRWYLLENSKKTSRYAVCGQRKYLEKSGVDISSSGKVIWMHRLLMNFPNNFQVDHINGNSLDNRCFNLRICTASENGKNRSISNNNSLGVKGVYKENIRHRGKCFRARIRVNGKRISLGIFQTPREAEIAYKEASRLYFKEFSRESLNLSIT